MGQTIVEKILSRTSRRKIRPGETIFAEPDLIVMYGWPGISNKLFTIIEEELNIKRLATAEKNCNVY
jgi:hypothetical protein